MKQVSNEDAVRELAEKIKALDACDEESWGKSWKQCIKEALELLELTIDDVNMDLI